MNTTDTLRIALALNLALQGCVPAEGLALATKHFATAVGPKQAIFWLSPAREGSETRMLSGEYWSEGRNILAASCRVLPTDTDDASAARIAIAFMSEAEREINQSYAVRLLGA